jgi:leucyl-tRNA synthetase
MERWSFNTSVAACMEFTNELQRTAVSQSGAHRATYDAAADALLLLLAPMTPHVTAEAWERRHGVGARSTPSRGRRTIPIWPGPSR